MTRKLIALLLSIMTIISVESIAIIPAQAADDKLTTIAEKDKEPPDGYILSLPDTEDIEVGKEGGVGEDAGVADMVKANVSLGAGITKTVGKSYQVSSTIQAEIPKSSKTGYYKMHVCYNFYRTKVIQKYTNGNVAATKYISMPYGESYAAVLYSSSTANGSWSIW